MTDTLSTGWPAPAKLNLFLHVTGRRPDGYHMLQTVFQFVAAGDWVDFVVRPDGRLLRAGDVPGVSPEQDLMIRAARRLQESTGCALGAEIRIQKNLPLGGGLGGGSSDAATVLVALNALWGTGVSVTELARLGLDLGADVPVFVHGRSAWAEGVGEQLSPLVLPENPVLIVVPDCAVNTGLIFAQPDLTRDTPPLKMHAPSLERTHNDCEPVTRRLYPAVGEALDWLSRFGPTRMSGSGASVFAMFEDNERAQGVASQVPSQWKTFATHSLNRSPLLERLRRFHLAAGHG